ncbi:MAG: HD domain-containing protein [Synergistaceae bacterium]|nr:HD domain-containing protein [Synergistaceae bacterium]
MANKNLNIKQVRQLGVDASFNVLGVVTRLNKRKDKNDRTFWDIFIVDGTGELDGKIWSNAVWWDLRDAQRVPINPENIKELGLKFESSTVGLQGKITEYRDQMQYTFTDIYYVDQKKYPPQSFMQHSPIPDEELEARFKNLLAQTNEPVKSLLNKIFFDDKFNLWEDFKSCPGAPVVHHAYSGGLLEHSLAVAENAFNTAKFYLNNKLNINTDLVIAGALLHDLGKIDAYAWDPVPRMLAPGNVLGHITMGYHKLAKILDEEIENGRFDETLALALEHIILSHHGKREYGSPVTPAIPEAIIVSAADNTDFEIFCWKNKIDGLDSNQDFTEHLPLFDRRFWRGVSRQPEDESKPEQSSQNLQDLQKLQNERLSDDAPLTQQIKLNF